MDSRRPKPHNRMHTPPYSPLLRVHRLLRASLIPTSHYFLEEPRFLEAFFVVFLFFGLCGSSSWLRPLTLSLLLPRALSPEGLAGALFAKDFPALLLEGFLLSRGTSPVGRRGVGFTWTGVAGATFAVT